MKKIVCLIGMILCLALGGTAFAAISYYNATSKEGTITADSAIVLSFGDSEVTAISLAQDVPAHYTVACNVANSTSVTPSCKLKISLTALDTKVMDKINVAVFTENTYTTAYEVESQPLVLQGTDATKYFEIAGIENNDTYYLEITLDAVVDQAEFAAIGANLKLELINV